MYLLNYHLWCRIHQMAVNLVTHCLILPAGLRSMYSATERIKVTPWKVRKIKVADNLPASTFNARVSCRFEGRLSNRLEVLVPFAYNKLTCGWWDIWMYFITRNIWPQCIHESQKPMKCKIGNICRNGLVFEAVQTCYFNLRMDK